MAGMPGPSRSTFVYLYHITRIVVFRLSSFSRDGPCFMGYKEPRPGEPQNSVRDARCRGIFEVIKIHFLQSVRSFGLSTEEKTSLRVVQPSASHQQEEIEEREEDV